MKSGTTLAARKTSAIRVSRQAGDRQPFSPQGLSPIRSTLAKKVVSPRGWITADQTRSGAGEGRSIK